MKTFTKTKTVLMTVFLVLSISTLQLRAQSVNIVRMPEHFSHQIFDKLLQQYVSEVGKVDYEGFKSKQAKLKSYLDQLAITVPNKNWHRDEQIAFWINAYNAHVIYMVTQAYPVASIIEIDGGRLFTETKLKIAGQFVTLNEIENDILIQRFYEPRIHFAINNSARSCPPLMAKAWTGDKLNMELNHRTYKFINHKRYNHIEADAARLSKIFLWKANDFKEIKTYINKYSPINMSADSQIKYIEYDWKLNQQGNHSEQRVETALKD